MNRFKAILIHSSQGLLGAFFVLQGFIKFTDPVWETMFARFGYFDGFVYIIAVAELALGVGMIIPRLRMISAAGLAVIMLGASVTHLIHDGPLQIIFTGVLFLLLSGITLVHLRKLRGPSRSHVPRPETD